MMAIFRGTKKEDEAAQQEMLEQTAATGRPRPKALCGGGDFTPAERGEGDTNIQGNRTAPSAVLPPALALRCGAAELRAPQRQRQALASL